MKKLILLSLFICIKMYGQSVELKPGSNGFVMIPNVALLGTCVAPDKGKIVYLSTDNTLRMCNGSSWTNVSSGTISLPFSQTGSSTVDLFKVENTSTSNGNGIVGKANASSGFSSGVSGENSSSGNGVYGKSASGNGVYGFSQSKAGVYGLAYGTDSKGVRGYSENGYGQGVYGEAESGIGVYGHAQNYYTGTGIGGYFSNASVNGYALITGIGKVGIGLSNPNEILDVNGRIRIRHTVIATVPYTSGLWMSNSANSLSSADGAFYGMKTDTETGIYIGNFWRFWVNNFGNIGITGFTQLGNTVPVGAAATASATAIKTMLLTGTTASAEGGSASVATGLANSKILSYTVLTQNGVNQFQPEHLQEAGHQYHTFLNNGTIFVRNSATNSAFILNKSFKVFVTYTE